jgi:hypothetical protein
VGIVVQLFYAATLGALAFFVHKVLWLVQYKRLQGALVDSAVKKLRDDNLAVLEAWEAFATERWGEALGQPDVKSPSNFIRRVEEWIHKLKGDMRTTRKSLETALANALAEGVGVDEAVLSLRRLGKGGPERNEVRLVVPESDLASPKPPDPRLFELNVRSRYGLVRRALVFFSGAADVVYSSQHVALMSQNAHVPTGVLVRRLSLVFLVIACVLADMAFGLRSALTDFMNGLLFPAAHAGYLAAKTAAEKTFFEEHGGAILAFGVWMAGYGAIYIGLFLSVRRNYQVNKRRLAEMRASEKAILASLRDKQVRELVNWGKEYGRSLDGAVGITLRHAETLLDHCEGRLRRRIAGPELFEGARKVGEALFAKLPESTGSVQDAVTTHPHSFMHYVWPRLSEMGYQIQLAQYRAAWQHVEVAESDLRKEQPDPHRAHSLWRAIVTYATIFASILPAGTADELRAAYASMVEATIEATDKDLEELDRRLAELTQRLNEQLDSARPLIASRIELANQSITAASLSFAAEVIHVREQARLEAMAFEI